MKAIVTLLTAVFCCGVVQAQVPHQINYQGYLTNSSGTPVNTTVSMTLKLWDQINSGNVLHTETQSVTVTNGAFNVVIGTAATLNAAFNIPYFLGVTVAPDATDAQRHERTHRDVEAADEQGIHLAHRDQREGQRREEQAIEVVRGEERGRAIGRQAQLRCLGIDRDVALRGILLRGVQDQRSSRAELKRIVRAVGRPHDRIEVSACHAVPE